MNASRCWNLVLIVSSDIDFNVIVIVGGDGTFNEYINKLIQADDGSALLNKLLVFYPAG